jgi:cyclopropane-fatty-acyl-phospholipid synthase
MTDSFWSFAIGLAERGLIPDQALRWGIGRLCAERLAGERARGESSARFAERMRRGPVAPVPEKANEQHYEAPPEFFRLALGPRLKYSCCWWGDGAADLAQAEQDALRITAERAELADGQRILELGCGWGSLSLWMAERFPNARIVSVSNSAPQRRFIEERAVARSLSNLRVVTADMNSFETQERFDRVVSVEMFEHMRNYEDLLARVARWLEPHGKLFVHIFCHRRYAYEFTTEGAAEWMGRHFFTGGIMPSLDIFEHFGRDLRVARQWTWDGSHYARTAEAWLANADANRAAILAEFAAAYGEDEARRMFERWRIFFLACAGLWGYAGGAEWLVGHYLLEPVSAAKVEPAMAALDFGCQDCR